MFYIKFAGPCPGRPRCQMFSLNYLLIFLLQGDLSPFWGAPGLPPNIVRTTRAPFCVKKATFADIVRYVVLPGVFSDFSPFGPTFSLPERTKKILRGPF